MSLPYTIAWFALAVIAIVNGVIRQFTYGRFVSELAAHQISTVTAVILSGLFVAFLHRFWPIESSHQAWIIGGAWLLMTIIFEFGFGHFVVGHTWSRLFADYNLLTGHIWMLFLLWIFLLPNVVYKYA
ncbi:MAG TPA: hypothetical protein VJ984_07795 [Xanthomonadales bacterium]|nr:hypothetical protein [Xanthomonadales bacterium]